jgi:hypothetical protein
MSVRRAPFWYVPKPLHAGATLAQPTTEHGLVRAVRRARSRDRVARAGCASRCQHGPRRRRQREEAAAGSRAPRETDRVICTLWCSSCHPAGDLRQPAVKCNQSTAPTLEHAVRALRLKIVRDHAGCLAAAEAARAAAGGPSSRPPPDAVAALMAASRAQAAADRAEAAVKAAA